MRPYRPNFDVNVSSDEASDDESDLSSNATIMESDEVANGDIVSLTHIDDHLSIFVRPVKYDKQFESLLKEINSTKLRPVSTPLQENEMLLVKFSGDYTRAITIDPMKMTVKLIDFGHTTDVEDLAQLRCIPPGIDFEKPMVLPVKLKLTENLTQIEKSAVITYLSKWKNNKFFVQTSNPIVAPYSITDLVHVTSGSSLTKECSNVFVQRNDGRRHTKEKNQFKRRQFMHC